MGDVTSIKKKQPTFKQGDVVYCKQIKKSSAPKTTQVTLDGHAICLLLGMKGDSFPDINKGQLMALLGNLGFLLFDDVTEFLGDEACATCVKKFEQKYYPSPPVEKPVETVSTEIPAGASPIALQEKPQLVGLSGKPLVPEGDPQ